MEGSPSATALASYAYTLDAAGHRLSVSELSGRTVNYGYDSLYRLTSETIASDPGAERDRRVYLRRSRQSQAGHFDGACDSCGDDVLRRQ